MARSRHLINGLPLAAAVLAISGSLFAQQPTATPAPDPAATGATNETPSDAAAPGAPVSATGTTSNSPFLPPAALATGEANPFEDTTSGAAAPTAVGGNPAVADDPFADTSGVKVASDPVSPFDGPSNTAPPAVAAKPVVAPAEDDPFAVNVPEPASSATAEAAADSPFDQPGTVTAAPASGAPPTAAAPTSEDPFATTTGVATTVAPSTEDPFSSPPTAPAAATAATPANDDPFATTPSATAATAAPVGSDDPFATPPTATAASPAPIGSDDPFATETAAPAAPSTAAAAPTEDDPFAAGAGTPTTTAATTAPGEDDPFGAPAAATTPAAGTAAAAPAPGEDPFGAPAGATAAAPGSDPFGDGTTAAAAPAPTDDPFGAPAAAGAPGETVTAEAPPGGAPGAAGADPFGLSSTADAGQVNPNGINQVYAFRYEKKLVWNGDTTVSRRKLTKEEADTFDKAMIEKYKADAQAGRLPNYVPGGDLTQWSEWAYFSEQYGLWSDYVNKVVLAGSNKEQSAWDMVQWPGQPRTPGVPGAPGQAAAAPQPNIINEASTTSLDDQTSDLLFGSSAGGGGAQAGGPLSPDTITNQVVTAYNTVLTKLRDLETDQESFMESFEARLKERSQQRVAYLDWRDNQQTLIEEFISDWNRRSNGSVAMIGGVRYELYKPGEVPKVVHRDAMVVVTDYSLTPHDIINPEDGTLKEPARQ